MDVTQSIWLSSLTSALFFFCGGRLWGKTASLLRAIEPMIRSDRAARRRAEQDVATVRTEAAAEIGRLLEIVARQAEEVDALRKRVRDLEALGPARREAPSRPALWGERPPSGQMLEEAIEERLEALRLHEGSCRTAVLSDLGGLLVASSGERGQDDHLAAAASMTSGTTSRLRQILPLDEPLEIRLVDVNRTVFTARWLRGDHDGLLLSTLGADAAEADPRADAIRASISTLICGT